MTSESHPTPPPTAQISRLMAGFQVSQALYAVAKLDVPTMLANDGPLPVNVLAERAGADPGALHRLIRSLTPLGVFSSEGDRVRVTELGAILSREHPSSMYNAICYWMETHYLPFSELLTAARTGRPAADVHLGEPFFDWIAADSDRAELQNRAMTEFSSSLRTGMFDGYVLPEGKVVADIGGASGNVLAELLGADPDRLGIVFDLPAIVSGARDSLARNGLADRVEVVAGDFFESVPTADVYVLSYILHDWDDESSLRILGSIAAAADSGARVLLLEGVVPADDLPHLSKMMDLTMLGMLTGQERSAEEYRVLLDRAGFTLDRIVETPTPYSIVEATLR
ncbi:MULTISPECIES: methyltransferase [unclassified Saccharopolyspora]|uniref:methyltransferase n=1 Tax=Saccharopolyspora TaxID=1835 RepID=UPI00190C05D9|nr:methyltransferase [Saccharopolyspora sp. HNM0986]MBK0870100.1 hypothetical protein [Saccharopolyspora sp. HNM0986]